MEKIKIKLNNDKNIAIKFKGKKFYITPYINLENTLILYDYCKNVIGDNISANYNNLILLEMVYSVGVVRLCSNLNVDDESLDSIVSSGLLGIIKQNISNYQETYNLIKLSIEQDDNLKLVNLITDALPSVKEQTKDLREAGSIIENMVKNASLDKVISGDLEKSVLNSPVSLINSVGDKKKTKSKK